jgi:hypothetical protein
LANKSFSLWLNMAKLSHEANIKQKTPSHRMPHESASNFRKLSTHFINLVQLMRKVCCVEPRDDGRRVPCVPTWPTWQDPLLVPGLGTILVRSWWCLDASVQSNWELFIIPIGSMYAIYGNIYHQYTPNVSIYTIHGSYGIVYPGSVA